MDKFPTIIKQLRDERNLTQKELSEMLGMKTYTTITKWEAGENFPKGKDIKRLAEIFSVTSDYLLGLKEKEHKSSSKHNLDETFNKLDFAQKERVLKLVKYDLDNISLEILEILSKTDENFKNDMLVYTKFKYLEYEKLEEEKNVDNRNTAS